MPPRLQLASRIPSRCLAPQTRPIAPSLAALFTNLSLQTHARHAHILASLRDLGTSKNRKRVGRGPSSGHGKTSGRGQKGQKAHGHVQPWFQGGQTPLIVSRGMKGIDNIHAQDLSITNLDQIQDWIDRGRLDPTKRITPKELIECGILGKVKDGVKLLARGKETLKTPIDIMVSRASAEAIAAVEAAGGKIVTRYYTKQAIRWLLDGKSINTDKPLPVGAEHVEEVLDEARKTGFKLRLPDPTGRWDIEYYRDPAHRGYLSHTLQPGENPSLFFGVPAEKKMPRKGKPATEKQEGTMW